jgi:hypothetical protein
MTTQYDTQSSVVGHVSVYRADSADIAKWTPLGDPLKNLVMFDWAVLAAKQVTVGGPQFRINAMYIEYQNVASPGNTVTPPALARGAGITYYNSLSGSSNTDFLRLPMTAVSTRLLNNSYSGDNIASFYAMTQGVTGIHGRSFSDSANSKIYSAALVCMQDELDRTKDLIVCRWNFPAGQQQLKLPSSQYGLKWELTFL